ncbi:MAG: hypothetical protein ABI808_06465 [Pseudonocardiales bacterium]
MIAGVRITSACSAALLIALTACSSGAKPGQHKETDQAAGRNTTCAKQAAGHAVKVPAGFPVDFPVPAGMIITTAQDRGKGGLVITGVTATKFADVLRALQTELPAKGYTPENGEVEPHDAESDWTAAAYSGRWAIRELEECGGDTAVSVVARKK